MVFIFLVQFRNKRDGKVMDEANYKHLYGECSHDLLLLSVRTVTKHHQNDLRECTISPLDTERKSAVQKITS